MTAISRHAFGPRMDRAACHRGLLRLADMVEGQTIMTSFKGDIHASAI